jgi:hypothetical protein
MAARQSPGWSSCVAAPGGRRVVGSHLAELRHEVLRVLDHVLGAQALGGGLGGGLAVRAGGGRQRDLAREARGGSRGAQNAHPRGSSGEFVRGGGGRAVARDALRDRSRFRARTCGRDPMAKLANPSPAAAPAPPGRRLTPAPPGRSEMASIVLSRPGGGARESALAKRGAFSKPAREARLVRSLWNDSTTPFEVRRDAIRRRGGVAKAARPRPRRARVLTGRGGANPDKRNPPRKPSRRRDSRLSSARAGRGFAFCR